MARKPKRKQKISAELKKHLSRVDREVDKRMETYQTQAGDAIVRRIYEEAVSIPKFAALRDQLVKEGCEALSKKWFREALELMADFPDSIRIIRRVPGKPGVYERVLSSEERRPRTA